MIKKDFSLNKIIDEKSYNKPNLTMKKLLKSLKLRCRYDARRTRQANERR